MNHLKSIILVSIVLTWSYALAQTSGDPLSYFFDRHYGQVEVGGRFAGAEFHESRPIPSRISFYYPVANSIDVSTDYWKRGNSLPFALGVRAGREAKRWLGREPWDYVLSPHKVTFHRRESELEYFLSYEFCMNQPAMVVSIKVKNISGGNIPVEVYTHLLLSLRTCQTYARKDSAWTEYDKTADAIIAHFDDPQTKQASVFVENAGVHPDSWSSNAKELAATDSGTSKWASDSTSRLKEDLLTPMNPGQPVAAFLYRSEIAPDDSLVIVQIVGSCPRDEVKRRTSYLTGVWRQEVREYDNYITHKAEKESHFITGDPWLDRSAIWARGLIASNAHFIDGQILPMPCPAEYNFFFTHDVLLTDLGAVNFDLPRVKRDLFYIASLSKEDVIPHAYYWRDNGFKTEFCAPDNWNHLWFILASASYYRHSLDSSTLKALYPLISKSIELIMTQRKADGLMYAKHPDWWDIGNREGPRSYLTILTIRALREFVYVSAALGKGGGERLLELERSADTMQKALNEKLWDNGQQFLTNFNGPDRDYHYYAGSLLAPFYGVLNNDKSMQLLNTARKELVDQHIGVRIVAPTDFNTDSMISYFKFVGNEAGAPYVYANGGVWPHSTAWYILALQACGQTDEAAEFLRKTLTLDGVAQSAMGQPAMYEYRFADTSSVEFGKIDKPSFLWAGGFYLNVLYRLFGVSENEWNLSASKPRPSDFDSASFSLAFGAQKNILIEGKGETLHSYTAGDENVASLILPLGAAQSTQCKIEFGKVRSPYLEGINAILYSAQFAEKTQSLECVISSFNGHAITARIIGATNAKKILLDGNPLTTAIRSRNSEGNEILVVSFTGSEKKQNLRIIY
ncbi:MAG: amylo-alpha-1,6-glucosidase [Bacteroidota bacterium]